MDNLPQNLPQVPIPQKSFFQTIKGKIVATVLGMIVILITLVALDYSKVIPVRSKLGFLVPRQPTSQSEITSTKMEPEKAKLDTNNLLNEVIITELIPSNLVFAKQNVNNLNNYTFYGTGWQTKKNETFVATIEYNEKNILIDRQISIHIPKVVPNLEASKAASLVQDYTKIIPKNSFSCTNLPLINFISIFCESFWQDTDTVRKGITLTSPVKGIDETQLLYCEHHPANPAYSWRSCSNYFKVQGVPRK